MATTHDIIFCLNATNMPGQGVCAHTVLSAINPEYVPGLFSFSTIITLLGIDSSKSHNLKLTLSYDNENIAFSGGAVPLFSDESNLPGEYKGINLTVNWNNVEFKRNGLYKLSVYCDDAMIGSKEIYVMGKNHGKQQ